MVCETVGVSGIYMTGMSSQACKPKISMGQVLSVGFAYLSDL